MTTDNKFLWKSTIIVALIASATFLYFTSNLFGSWALGEFPVTLWCVWLGILLSVKVRVPVWLRAIILCSCTGLYFFFPQFNVQISGVSYMLNRLETLKYVILFLFGLGISPELKLNDKFRENLVLFVIFLFFYIFMMLVERRSWLAMYDEGAEPVEILWYAAKYGKSIPLVAAILFCMRMALSDKMQTILSKKGISITALALIFAVCTLSLVRSVITFGQIHLSVVLKNPAVSMIIILCIEKLNNRTVQCYCLDADNFKIIFPEDHHLYSFICMNTSWHKAIVSVSQSDIDKWTLTVSIHRGDDVCRKVFCSSKTVDQKPDELQIEQLRNAWTLCNYMTSTFFYKRRLFHKLFFSLALRDSYVRSIFQEWIKEAEHNKHIVRPNLIAPGPVTIEQCD